VRIGSIDTDTHVLVVAEIGNNHEGGYALAERLIGLAAEAGADAVKFQTIVPDRLVAPSQKDRVSQLQRFQLSYAEYEKLSHVAEREGVLFLSTPFDIESARFLNALVPAFKISSGDNNFWALIDVIARTGKPIILSSGFADLKEIRKTRDFIQEVWRECGIVQQMAVLHCVASYPTLPQEANLLAIKQLQEQLGVTVGYSDHTIGIEAAVLSVALGARIIEKHFTVDKNYSDFRDHQLSVDPQELALLVKRVREVVELLGDGEKRLQNGERDNIGKMRRSIVASRDLSQGTILQDKDLTWLRPGGGLAPGREAEVVGKRLLRFIPAGECILLKDVEEV
jgi:N,N'-diacetyllegionaminate synthase